VASAIGEILLANREMFTLETNQIQVTVIAVNHNPILLEGIAVLIWSQPDMQLMGTADGVDSGIRLYLETRPVIALLDLDLPDSSAIGAIARIRAVDTKARVIGLTTYELDKSSSEAFAAGVVRIIATDQVCETLVDLIREVADQR
jgi:DNA-binding NarL/FixJ family response regulator